MSDYSYTRTCPDCEGSGEEWMQWGDDYRRSGVICAYCGGDGVVDVYVEHEHELPVVFYEPPLSEASAESVETPSRGQNVASERT